MDNNTTIDWSNLSFGYMKTDYNVRCAYKDGKWGEVEVTDSEYLNIHMAATCLHYGQEIFEGLKAFKGKDGKIRIFRLEENAKRIQRSAEGIKMEPLPMEKFREMVEKVVKLNERFIPPYGSGSSLYIRPLEIGMSAQVGVKPATEYLFLIFVTPVGPYFKEGFKPTKVAIYREYDRAEPCGTDCHGSCQDGSRDRSASGIPQGSGLLTGRQYHRGHQNTRGARSPRSVHRHSHKIH